MSNHQSAGCKGLIAGLMVSGTLIPQLAYAENAAPDSSDTALAEVIVTANKRAESINNVGLTITAMDSETLERQGVKTLSDLAGQVPGLTYAPSDFGTPVFTLRGVGFYDNSIGGYPTTSVYVDEIPLSFPSYATHANLDLQRVEVLKGPQGTLFGQNSTGGAINYIAAKPTSTFSAALGSTIGEYRQGDVNGYISGPITESLKARLAFEHDFGADWQHSYTRRDSLGSRDVNNGRLLVEWQPIDKLNLLLNLNAWQDKSDPQADQLIALIPARSLGPVPSLNPGVQAQPFAPNDPTAADWDPNHRPSADKQQYQAAVRGDYQITHNIVLTSITSYVDYKVQQALDQGATPQDLYEYDDYGKAHTFSQELRVAGGEGTPFRWVAGGNYESSHVHESRYTSFFAASTFPILHDRDGAIWTDQKFDNRAVFVNGDYDLLPDLTLKLGGRYTHTRDTDEACDYDPGDGESARIYALLFSAVHPGVPFPATAPGACLSLNQNTYPGEFVDTLRESNYSWHAGLDYKVAPNVLLYVNAAKGFKAGAFPTIPATNYTSYLPVTQESLLDYEGGFKAEFFDRKLAVNGAAFYYDYTNKQLLTKILDPLVGATSALANIPKSVVKGAELEVTAVPIRGLHLSGGITYLQANITQYIGVNAAKVLANFAGTPMPFTPKWQYLLSADYDFPIDGNIQPFVGASLTGRTGTTSIVGTLQGQILNPGYRSSLPLDDIYLLPAYHVLDLRAGIQSRDGTWKVMAWAKNVTNTYYWQNVTALFDGAVRFTGQPRTYGVTASYQFR